MNPDTLISCHGYSGDASQIKMLLGLHEAHKCPIVVVSPTDAPITEMGGHTCIQAGGVGYIGQVSWDRQVAQMKALLDFPFKWICMHDSDSLCLNPVFPDYLYSDENVIYSNLVEDFRKPGETSHGQTWPTDYHAGFPIQASQPSYFCSRSVLERLVAVPYQVACPITPFIDWQMIVLPTLAGVGLRRFERCASCETQTENGIAVMTQCVVEHGAEFIHAIKTENARDIMVNMWRARNGIQ